MVRADVKIFGDDGWEQDLPPEKRLLCSGRDTGRAGEGCEEQSGASPQGWQTAIHLTGGRGIDISVDALSEAEEEEPGRDLRHLYSMPAVPVKKH